MFQTKFSGQKQNLREQKTLGGTVPEYPPWLRAWCHGSFWRFDWSGRTLK